MTDDCQGEAMDEPTPLSRRGLVLGSGGFALALVLADMADAPGAFAAEPTWNFPFTFRVGIQSGFGWRPSPGAGGSSQHEGVDYSPARYTPVHATAAGVVSRSIDGIRYHQPGDTGYGNRVEIDHGGGYVTRYAHLEMNSPIPYGTVVCAGQKIGEVGSSGASTGPHLHLEILVNGEAVDPAPKMANTPLANPNCQPTAPSPLLEDDDEMFVIKDNGTGHCFLIGKHYIRHLTTTTDANLMANILTADDQIHVLSSQQAFTVIVAMGIPRAYTNPDNLPHGGRGGWWSLQDAIHTQGGGTLTT